MHASVQDITHGIWRSVELFHQGLMLREIRQKMMQLDFSWEASVRAYLDLYDKMRWGG
jgi:starch synthase